MANRDGSTPNPCNEEELGRVSREVERQMPRPAPPAIYTEANMKKVVRAKVKLQVKLKETEARVRDLERKLKEKEERIADMKMRAASLASSSSSSVEETTQKKKG